MKKNLTKIFENNGVVKFQDRAGRMRDMNRYVDMLTRTETKIANTQGTINRALES
nr:MAG TPA: minor capsid protein [Caudoviricetes sp.]